VKVKSRFAAAALLLAVSGPVFAQDSVAASTAPAQDPTSEIQVLRARLDQLEVQQKAAEIKAQDSKTTSQVIDDAARHSQMLEVGDLVAGHKGGRFFIGSDDGSFNFRPWLHLQFREVTNMRQNFKPGGDDDVQSGFEVRRMRFGFDGNAFSPDLTYMFNWATVRAAGTANVNNAAGTRIGTVSNNLGGVPLLEEAWVKYNFHNSPFYVKGGQIKDPLLHDQIVSSRYQQSAERSLTADVFANGDAFLEGVTFIYDPKTFMRFEGGVTHGIRSANTNFLDYPNTNAFNYGAAARGEFKVFGDWKDYSQVGAVGTKSPLLVIGVGADYSERGHSNQLVGAVDAMYADQNGLSVYGAFVDRYSNHNFGIYNASTAGASIAAPPAAILGTPTNEYAAMIQAGLLIDKHVEPFGRFEYLRLRGTATTAKNFIPVVTGGVNYYFFGHGAKLTAQATYLPHGIPIDDTGSDILALPSARGELVGIVQFQLSI
jgi:hypothetical protein